MTSVEEQLRLYANDLTAGKELIPERRLESGGAGQPRRGLFLVAAAILVVVVLAAAVIGLRSRRDDSSPASATTTSGNLTTTLKVSTTNPAPGEVVTATVTVTNHGTESVELVAECHFAIAVETEPPDQLTFPSASPTMSNGFEINYGHGFFLAPDGQTLPELTVDDMFQSSNSPTSPDTVNKLFPSCPYGAPKTELAAGETATFTKALTVGGLGLPAGPGHITTVFFGANAPANPVVPITLPEPTTTPISRSDAIKLALAQPAVAQIIPQLPEMPSGGTTVTPSNGSDQTANPNGPVPVTNPPPETEQFYQSIFANPVEGGWQIGYASGDYAFLAKVNNDGSIGSVETSTSGH